MTAEKFIETLKPHAVKLHKEKGIRASLAIAQACLESGYGKYIPANSYNIYGIKWKTAEDGDYVITKSSEFIKDRWVVTETRFRKYKSYYESIEDYGDFLLKYKRYKAVLAAKNAKEACLEIQKAGYATDPEYANKLITIINKYQLEEYDIDKAKMNIVVIDKKGKEQEVSLEKIKNIDNHIFFEGRYLVELIGGTVSYDDKTNTAVFDLSNK